MKTEHIISISKANLIAMIMIVPIGLILGLPMVLAYGFEVISFKAITSSSPIFGFVKFALAITIGIVIHELLHGIGWTIFAKKGWKSISFGVKWEYMTPYCHCNEPLKRNQFIVGAILPLIVLGLIPAIFAFINGSFILWFYGFFFTIAAGGDIIAIWMMRKVKRDQWVQDHPSELGFIIVDKI